MRKGKLFASILAGIAALAGVSQTAPGPVPVSIGQQVTGANIIQAQRDGTRTPTPAPPAAASVQNLRAGATIVPLYIPRQEVPRRWAWVGRKVRGRFDYYARAVA